MSSLGYLAFIRDPTTRLIHIGYADQDVRAHLSRLECAAQHQLVLLATLPGTRADLRQLDQLFAPVDGWCVLSPALWAFLSQRCETTRAFGLIPRPR